ncbi:HEAT repeat domain-containing protein [Paludisphaera soli]|uniref:HEAT repeat domain-containing protein n=1 Tax=Paludisphaera soli TaxID=2712865 RepID=UPI0013EE2D30|nr:HEAT repeat domain-containing protein [Paludisphaera soli]
MNHPRRRRPFGPLFWSTLAVAGLAVLGLAVREVDSRWGPSWRARGLAAEMRNPDPRVGLPAARALSKAGDPAIPRLVEALRDGDPAVRRRASWALGLVIPLPAAAIPALGAAIRDDDAEVRRRAADALARFGPEAASQAAALRAALGDPDPDVRFGAARCLARVEASESEALRQGVLDLLTVPVVHRLADPGGVPNDPDPTAPADLLKRMSPETQARGVGLLASLLGSDDAPARRAAAASLLVLSDAAGPASPELEKASRSDDLATRCLATLALVEMEGWERGRARATLRELLEAGALHPGVVPPRTLQEVQWVLTANLEGGSEIYQPVHVLRDLAVELSRAGARPAPASPE